MSEDLTNTLRSARPTILVGGQEKAELAAGLSTLLVIEHISGIYRCEAKFANWGTVDNKIGFLYFDRRTLDFGKDFKIKLGDDTLFNGKIMGLEADYPDGQAPEISVLAEDRFQDLRMTRRTRSFEDATDFDVIDKIATDHGLSKDLNVTGPKYKVLAQVNQSDLAFMRERARAIDAEVWMDGSTLHAATRADRNGGSLQMTRGNQLREFRVLADLALQRTSVTVNGWDVASKKGLNHKAEAEVISSELNGDASGVSILDTAFGERKKRSGPHGAAQQRRSSVRSGGFFQDVRAPVSGRSWRSRNQREAACRRQGRLAESRSPLQWQVLRRRSNPSFRQSERSAHRIPGGASGDRTRVRECTRKILCELVLDMRVPSGLGGRWYGVFPALVSDINDPDNQGRVKVTLPWSGSEQYEVWARLATMMGGNNRGSWFIPDER